MVLERDPGISGDEESIDYADDNMTPEAAALNAYTKAQDLYDRYLGAKRLANSWRAPYALLRQGTPSLEDVRQEILSATKLCEAANETERARTLRSWLDELGISNPDEQKAWLILASFSWIFRWAAGPTWPSLTLRHNNPILTSRFWYWRKELILQFCKKLLCWRRLIAIAYGRCPRCKQEAIGNDVLWTLADYN